MNRGTQAVQMTRCTIHASIGGPPLTRKLGTGASVGWRRERLTASSISCHRAVKPSLSVFPRLQPIDGLVRGVMARGTHDAAARPGAGATQIEAGDRSLVRLRARHRAHVEGLL